MFVVSQMTLLLKTLCIFRFLIVFLLFTPFSNHLEKHRKALLIQAYRSSASCVTPFFPFRLGVIERRFFVRK